MLIVALDTSSAAGSAALVRDERVVLERAGDPTRTHGERLPRDLMLLLEDAGVDVHDVDRFAVATGPGSFTGLRIGIATIQGLALAQGTLVIPVSSFEALHASAIEHRTSNIVHRTSAAAAPSVTAVWIDAHRGEVFATLYAADGTVLHEPTSLTPDATLDAWSAALDGRAVQFAGDGALRHRAVIERRLGAGADIPEGVVPLAGAIGVIAARHPDRAVAPHAVVPLYVRRSDAELARDRRRAADTP
jgi:tRNA threonylcarbamoyladenosine biosynthesis protein TsaB